jgi:hypothetical protein
LSESICRAALACALRGEPWPAGLVDEALLTPDGRALFAILAEGLSDRFEPRLCGAYADLFSEVIARVLPQFSSAELRARYERVRRPRVFEGDAAAVENVVVLSRVTLGADVAVTSLMLDAAKRRFPNARIVLAGSRKNYELFAGDPRIEHLPVNYGRRESIEGRLTVGLDLAQALAGTRGIVIDPDSRLTQLGLLPVCDESSYYFFESRAYGAQSSEPLSCLARRWLAETFGIDDARAFIAPPKMEGGPPGLRPAASPRLCAVSFGVGENPAKRVPDPFEPALLEALDARGFDVIVDTGPGGEEAERAQRAAAGRARTWQGSFADFASIIALSKLYVGYDSAAQHVAAACGVPLVSVFAGYPCERFLHRWRPWGPGPAEVVRAGRNALAETLAAVDRLRAI